MSFYPPPVLDSNVRRVALDAQEIVIGFFRLRQKENFVWQSLDELAGQRLAVFRTYKRKSELLQQFIDADLELVEVEDLTQGFQLLHKQRVDMVMADLDGGNYILNNMGLDPVLFQFSESILQSMTMQVWINNRCEMLDVMQQP